MQKTVSVRDVSLDDIFREIDQQHMEELRQVKKSGGVLPLPIVRQDGGLYPLIAHFHSYFALTADGEEKVTVELIDRELSPKDILLMQGQENELRKEFSFFERVKLYRGLIAHGMTQAEVAEQMGRKEPFISKTLKRAERTHPDVLELYCSGKLGERHTDAISKLPPVEQVELAAKVVAEGWKAERTEKDVKRRLGKVAKRNRKLRIKTPALELATSCSLEDLLAELVKSARAVRKAIRMKLPADAVAALLAG